MEQLTEREKAIITDALIDVIGRLSSVRGKLSTPERAKAVNDEINDLQKIIEKVNK